MFKLIILVYNNVVNIIVIISNFIYKCIVNVMLRDVWVYVNYVLGKNKDIYLFFCELYK